MDPEMIDLLRENLPPKALEVFVGATLIKQIGEQTCKAIDAAEAEVVSDDGAVCVVADGQGFLTELIIADWAVADLDLEALEETISETLVRASGLGQAAGEKVFADLDERLAEAGLAS